MARGKKVSIGFVGVGSMGQCAHLRNYVLLDDCEVVAIAEPRENRGREVARRYGVPNVYTGYEEMLEKEELDGIVACQPFNRHGVLIPKLLEYGIPLFIEKPLAGTVEAGEKIVAAAIENETWIMVGYHKRSDPATVYAKNEIDTLKSTQRLGKLQYVRITIPSGDWIAEGFRGRIHGNDPTPEFETDSPASDMDAETFKVFTSFVSFYIHQVNLMRHLLGESYGVKYADPAGVLFAGQSRSGVPCVIEMSPYITNLDWPESALVAFEHGYVRLDLPAPLAINRAGTVEILRDPSRDVTPVVERPQMPWTHAMLEQAANFVKALQGEAFPPSTAVEALEDLKLAREYVRLYKGV